MPAQDLTRDIRTPVADDDPRLPVFPAWRNIGDNYTPEDLMLAFARNATAYGARTERDSYGTLHLICTGHDYVYDHWSIVRINDAWEVTDGDDAVLDEITVYLKEVKKGA